MAFLTLGTMQLTVAIALRARPRTWANPFLLVAVGSAWLLQLSAVYVPPLQNSLEPNRSRCVTSPSSQGYRYWVTQASGWTVSCTRDKPDSKRSESSMLRPSGVSA